MPYELKVFEYLEQSDSHLANFLAQSESLSDAISSAGDAMNQAGWSWGMLIPIFLGAIGYLLIQEGVVRGKGFIAGGIAAWTVSAGIALAWMPVSLDSFILYAFCALATGGGVAFLTARQPVYAALGFTTAVLSTSGVLFMQSALFIAAATMIVYAGATIIIFLFVLMFAQQSELRAYDLNLTNPYLATSIGVVMFVAIAVCVLEPGTIPSRRADATRPYSEATLGAAEGTIPITAGTEMPQVPNPLVPSIPDSTAELGRSLYTDYLAAVELAGAVLLVATIGAIALATRPAPEVNG
ncbi:MAG: NADH-quinone oxidoreductase subunit J [Pirellula sp.]|nr:NADH-quinone oxidoreductase subunit J [Pirellula sp.]